MKILLTALTLAVLPFAAVAQCAGSGHEQAMSCMEGTMLNPETGICEPITTG